MFPFFAFPLYVDIISQSLFFRCSFRHILNQRDVVALEKDLACGKFVSRIAGGGVFSSLHCHAPSGRLDSLSLVLVIWRTSTASSRTRFMNSSKPWTLVSNSLRLGCRLMQLTRILPSMRMPSCSYSQTLTVEFCFVVSKGHCFRHWLAIAIRDPGCSCSCRCKQACDQNCCLVLLL